MKSPRPYSLFLPLLLSLMLLSDVVGATSKTQKLQIAQQPTPTQPDATRAAAKKALLEGLKLYKQGTGKSLRQALAKWHIALPLWQKLGDKFYEATTLVGIGRVYSDLGDKQQALTYYNQALPIYRQVGHKRGEANTLNNIGQVYSDLGDKQQALTYYNQALPIYRQVGHKRGEANTLNNIGLVYSDVGDKQQALFHYNQALPIYRQVGHKSGEATTLNNLGQVYSVLGDKQKALSYYNQALSLLRQVGDKGREAAIFNNIGTIYSDLGDKQKALFHYNQALPLLRQVGDKRSEAIILNGIGTIYLDLGDKQKALSYYNQALPLRRRVGDKSGEANTLNSIGRVYSDLGDKQKALFHYNQALPLRRQVGDKSGEASTLNNLGTVYSDLGDKQQALSYFNQALPLFRQVGDKRDEANTLNNLGFVYNKLGDKQQALSYHNQALLLRQQVGDKSGEANTLNNIAGVYSDLGDKQKALSHLNQSLPLRRQVGDKGGEANTLNNLGFVYNNLGDKQQALSYYNQALPIYRQVGNKSGEANTLLNLAYLERNKGNLQTALTQIEAAIKIIEELRTKIDSQELRTSYFATVQGYYQFYIDSLMQLHKKEPSKGYAAQALHISERSRARSLVELLTEANIDIRKNINSKLATEEQRLQQLRDAKEKQLSQLVSLPQPSAKLIAATKKEIEDILKQQRELTNKIRASNPEYAALKYPQPLTLPQIQQQLDKDTLLLQYAIGEERSYLWAVTPNSINTYELPGRKKISQAAQNYKKPLLTCQSRDCQNLSPAQKAQFFQAATQLSQIILAPVANKLGDKRLVIVADGALQDIPFAALVAPNTPVTNQKDYQPLILKHEIVNLPSMTAIATQRKTLRQRQPAPQTLAILANPVFSATDTRVTGKPEPITQNLDIRSQLERSALKRAAKNINRNEWGALPGTLTEAQAILSLVPSQSRLSAFDFDANYDWATNKQLAQYRYVHFATHGFADPTNPELSGIVLSLVNKQGQPTRGYLRLADIFNLNLPAQLVVLSACETGLGKEVKGEGLVGLTRGLMYAGSATVALSLWQVNDEATPELMKEFYKQILQGKKSPNAALRAAQISMLQNQDWRYPYYWAAFTIQGEWR